MAATLPHRSRFCGIVALLGIAAAAGTVRVHAAERTATPATVAGTVKDEAGKPLAGATVRVFQIDQPEGGGRSVREAGKAETGTDGRFRFERLPSTGGPEDAERNSYELVVTHPALCSQLRRVAPREPDVAICLGPAGAVAGVVADPQGMPVAGAAVWRWDLWPLQNAVPGVWSAVTDERGRYEIRDLPRERTSLYARHPERGFKRGVSTDVPATADLRLIRAAAIEGRVVDGETGDPWAGASVSAQGIKESDWAEAVTDADGRYRLTPLGPDAYNVWASAPDRTTVALDSFPLPEGETRQAPDLRLVRGGFVAGRVTDATSGKPVCRTAEGWRLRVAVYGPSRPRSGAAVTSAPVRDDGTYRIRVAPGSNYVYVMRPDITDPGSHTVAVAEGETVTADFRTKPGEALPPEKPIPVQP